MRYTYRIMKTYLKNFLDFCNHKLFNLLRDDFCAQITEFCLNKFEAAASGCFVTSQDLTKYSSQCSFSVVL